jgi:hypothetical protein
MYLYKNSSGYTKQQIFERSVPSIVSCTTDTTGACTISGLLADTYDICASASGYYTVAQACQYHVTDTANVPLNTNTNTGTLTLTPPFYMKAIGTDDLAKTSSTIPSSGCTAGTSTCPLTIFYGQKNANQWLAYPAVKLTPKVTSSSASTNNLTFASMQQGTTCTYTVVNSVYYVRDPTVPFLGGGQYATCPINLNYASSSTDGKIGLSLQGGFIPGLYAAMAAAGGPGLPTGDYETNSNWNADTAVTLDVTR